MRITTHQNLKTKFQSVIESQDFDYEIIFTDCFIRNFTTKSNFKEFVNSSDLIFVEYPNYQELFKLAEWDNYIKAHSKFDDWAEMVIKAIIVIIEPKLLA